MRAEKAAKYRELKQTKNKSELNEWFLSYKPDQGKNTNPLEEENNENKEKKKKSNKNKNKNKKTRKSFFDFYGKKTRKNKKELY
jgi:hypothetical protein